MAACRCLLSRPSDFLLRRVGRSLRRPCCPGFLEGQALSSALFQRQNSLKIAPQQGSANRAPFGADCLHIQAIARRTPVLRLGTECDPLRGPPKLERLPRRSSVTCPLPIGRADGTGGQGAVRSAHRSERPAGCPAFRGKPWRRPRPQDHILPWPTASAAAKVSARTAADVTSPARSSSPPSRPPRTSSAILCPPPCKSRYLS